MNDGLDFFLVKNSLNPLPIQQVGLIEDNLLSCDLLHTLQGLLTGIVEVVHNYHLIARVQQLHAGVASDVPGSAGH